jgi:hypothetical protein
VAFQRGHQGDTEQAKLLIAFLPPVGLLGSALIYLNGRKNI